jgi:hypothetical protein
MNRRLTQYMLTLAGTDPFMEHRRAEAVGNQQDEALAAVKAARRPVKWNRIIESFTHAPFPGVYAWLIKHRDIRRSMHKGKEYFEYKPNAKDQAAP